MKRKILLIDESLTVQKVVALTLDKSRYSLYYAKSRNEALKQWSENPPELILVGDQVPDINAPSFPKEMEVWLGKGVSVPPMILITSHDSREQKNYAGVLKKPFAPSALQSLVSECLSSVNPGEENESSPDEFEDQRLQKVFNDTFADESFLVRETFRAEAEENRREEPETTPWAADNSVAWESNANTPVEPAHSFVDQGDLWGNPVRKNADSREKTMNTSVPVAPTNSVSDQQVIESLQGQDLNAIIDRVLTRIVPPIVERLVQERLDKLLKAQEEFVELKQ
jgi:CheY-like chemotaxis protein